MKVHQITCPKCKATLTSKAGIEEGTSVPCPKCKTKFAVRAPEEVIEDFEVVDDDEEEAPKKKPAPAPARPAAKRRDDEDDEEEERPAVKKKGRRDDEDDERPAARKKAHDEDEPAPPRSAARKKARDEDNEEEAPRSKRKGRDEHDDEEESPKARRRRRDDDEEDDDDRPRRKRRGDDDEDDEPKSGYAKLKSNMWVRVGVLTALLAIAGVLGYLLYEKRKKEKDSGSNDGDKVVNTDDAGGPKDFIVPPKDSRPPRKDFVPPKEFGPGKDLGGKKNPPGKLDQRLVGRWAFQRDDGSGNPFLDVSYRSDGTFTQTSNLGGARETVSGTWSVGRQGGSPNEIFVRRNSGARPDEEVRVRFDFDDLIGHDTTEGGMKKNLGLMKQK